MSAFLAESEYTPEPMDSKPTLRILIATPNYQVVGGVEVYLRAVIQGLAEHGHEVALLCERPESPGHATIDGLAPGIERWCAADDPDAALVRAEVWQPDVVFVQGLASSYLERTLTQRFPTVFFAHGYTGTCATGTRRHASPSIAICTRRFGPACLVVNYLRGCGVLNPVTLARLYRREVDRSLLFRQFRAVVVASTSMLAEFRRHGVPADRLHQIPLPTGSVTPDTHPPNTRPLTGRVLWLGRATSLKGGDRLIDAVPEAATRLGRPLSLTVAGDGPALDGWRARAARRGVAAEFVGWVDPVRRLELLRAADLLAVPSLWPEPFGLVGIEAGCVGLPAVGYAVGGIPDWLRPGQTGELAPGDPPTTAGLKDAIVRALKDAGHHARLRQGAWEMARRFSMERHLSALVPILAAAHAS